MKSHMTRSRRAQGGFTIIELLIATLVFSMVLILITLGIMQFTKSYYKGINQSRTQNAARTIIENIAQSIQFSGDLVTSPITPGPNDSVGFCIGSQRFSYRPGFQLVDAAPDSTLRQTRHALLQDNAGSCGGARAQDLGGDPTGTELLTPGMRVSKLSVDRIGTTDIYRVSIRVVFGDVDLVYSPSNDPRGAAAPDAACRAGFSGSQFCASSELSTIAKKRIIQAQ